MTTLPPATSIQFVVVQLAFGQGGDQLVHGQPQAVGLQPAVNIVGVEVAELFELVRFVEPFHERIP